MMFNQCVNKQKIKSGTVIKAEEAEATPSLQEPNIRGSAPQTKHICATYQGKTHGGREVRDKCTKTSRVSDESRRFTEEKEKELKESKHWRTNTFKSRKDKSSDGAKRGEGEPVLPLMCLMKHLP